MLHFLLFTIHLSFYSNIPEHKRLLRGICIYHCFLIKHAYFFFLWKRQERPEEVFCLLSNLVAKLHSDLPFLSLIFDSDVISQDQVSDRLKIQMSQNLRTVVFLKYSTKHSFKIRKSNRRKKSLRSFKPLFTHHN